MTISLIDVAACLFKNFTPVSLSSDDLKFFDKQLEIIVEAVLTFDEQTPEQARRERLESRDRMEKKLNRNNEENEHEQHDAKMKEVVRSIKTVEVMGMVIKNRAGSLEKVQIEKVFAEGMNVLLRALQSFFDLLKEEKIQQAIVENISNRLNAYSQIKEIELDEERSKIISRMIFWNMNYMHVYGMISRIIHSLGSDKLVEAIEIVCDRDKTPAAFLVKQGTLMWHKKELRVDEIKKRIYKKEKGDRKKEKRDRKINFSKTAERIMKHLIVDHCRFHPIRYNERQMISDKLNISRDDLERRTKKLN